MTSPCQAVRRSTSIKFWKYSASLWEASIRGLFSIFGTFSWVHDPEFGKNTFSHLGWFNYDPTSSKENNCQAVNSLTPTKANTILTSCQKNKFLYYIWKTNLRSKSFKNGNSLLRSIVIIKEAKCKIERKVNWDSYLSLSVAKCRSVVRPVGDLPPKKN